MSHPFMPTNTHAHLRMPLDSQRNLGGDMFISCPAHFQLPKRFSSPEQQQIKGLNFETVATIHFPAPAWMNEFEYMTLQPQSDKDGPYWRHFSLNFSLYNQPFNPSDWDDQWFIVYGRLHPYALTWEIEPENNPDTEVDVQDYTIPALIVRDHGWSTYCPSNV